MILENGKASITLPAEVGEFFRLSEWLETVCGELHLPLKTEQQILICADEISTNIASYAYPSGDGTFTVSAEYDSERKELKIVFTDHGVSFDPLQHEQPDIDLPLEQRQEGGLGILIVRRMMDRTEYSRIDGCNVLTLVKNTEGGLQS